MEIETLCRLVLERRSGRGRSAGMAVEASAVSLIWSFERGEREGRWLPFFIGLPNSMRKVLQLTACARFIDLVYLLQLG